MNTIEVTVDKSHIVTIGERLYGESIELIRELINNAYDADASEVKVTIKDDFISVEDDGHGMDMDGLRQYFNIGSTLKRNTPKSPKFGRDRIGEFGIGKFASLSACASFEVWTKKGDFQAKVIFDISDVEKRIIETVPIKAPNFAVYLNEHKVSARFIPGHRIPFMEGTEYGIVWGEIIISSQLEQDMSDAGIECKVKQVTITRDFFGLENLIKNIARIKGEVNADFLPITSDRSGFIKDTIQYKKFYEVMEKVIARIKPVIEELSDYKENKRAKRALTEVLEKVKNALILNPDYCPEGLIPIADELSDTGTPALLQIKDSASSNDNKKAQEMERPEKKKRKRKPMVKRLTPAAVVKKLKLGRQGVSCCIDHFGPDGPECLTEGAIVYINRNHPLYLQEARKKDTYILHIARLLTQEICLMKDPRNPRQAFNRQSKLLRDALVDKQ